MKVTEETKYRVELQWSGSKSWVFGKLNKIDKVFNQTTKEEERKLGTKLEMKRRYHN